MILLQDLVLHMHLLTFALSALGMYSLCCASVLQHPMHFSPLCRCCCQRHEVPNVECDDSNLDTTALSLVANVEEEEYLFYASWEVRVYQSPFAVLFDPDTNCIVVAIRGTLSIQVHFGLCHTFPCHSAIITKLIILH